MWTRNNDVSNRNMLKHFIYSSPSKPATSPLCSPYYRYSSELSSSFCILSFLVIATSIDQTFYSATHYLAAVWLDSRHGPNIISLLWTFRILILIFLKIDSIIYECLIFILTLVILLNNKILEENIVIINILLFYY